MSPGPRHPVVKVIGLMIIILVYSRFGEAQFPRVCTSTDNIRRKECCPTPPGFTETCGGPGRGRCADIPDATVDDNGWKPAYQVDDRRHWPTVFFTRACVCEGNFSGYDCRKCIWGRRGPNCSTKAISKRRNVRHLKSEDKEKLRHYLDAMKKATSDYVMALDFYEDIKGSDNFANVSAYDYFVALHYYASRATMPPYSKGYCKIPEDCEIDFAHQGSGFPTWHRAFLLEFERALQEVNSDPDFTIPYWDWTESDNCTVCTNDIVGDNNEDGSLDTRSVFATWQTICVQLDPFLNSTQMNHTKPCDVTKRDGKVMRNPGHQDKRKYGQSMDRLPLAAEVDFALRFQTFDNKPYNKMADCGFRNLLEGFADTKTGKHRGDRYENGTLVPGAHTLHNHVHLYLDGTMSAVPSSVNDPIFHLHHCFVDRILEKWIRRHRTSGEDTLPEMGAPPGHNRHEYIVPFFPPYSHAQLFKPSTELGYDYEDVDDKGLSDGEIIKKESSLGECNVEPGPDVVLYVVWILVAALLIVCLILSICCCCQKKPQRKRGQRIARYSVV